MSDRRPTPVQRIVSGGQTGVDRAGLNVAIALNIDHGGWCPRGRLAEDGPIPEQYNLQETAAAEYSIRTEKNVIDSDATLLLFIGSLQRGTLLTYRFTKRHSKPSLRVRLDNATDVRAIQAWLWDFQIKTLNIAGPRESSQPGIQNTAEKLLYCVFTNPFDLFEN